MENTSEFLSASKISCSQWLKESVFNQAHCNRHPRCTTVKLLRTQTLETNVRKWSESCQVMSSSSRPHRPYSPWNSLGQNTGVGSLSLLQGIFPNPGLPHCRWILYQLSHQESPRMLEWVAYPFSRGSPSPGIWTGVSCIAGRGLHLLAMLLLLSWFSRVRLCATP